MTTTIERPILFNGAMVRAILEGRKTQTRRVVKNLEGRPANSWTLHRAAGCADSWSSDSGWMGRCPYGQPGDRLWVREAFQPLFADGVENHWETDWKTGKGYAISYPATDGIHEYLDADDNLTDACKPSIHMPRWASRILLEITAVRVERLQDISEADARAEGVTDGGCLNCGEPEPCGCAQPAPDARDSFCRLWQSINGPGSWADNPWVWIVEFKRVQP